MSPELKESTSVVVELFVKPSGNRYGLHIFVMNIRVLREVLLDEDLLRMTMDDNRPDAVPVHIWVEPSSYHCVIVGLGLPVVNSSAESVHVPAMR